MDVESSEPLGGERDKLSRDAVEDAKTPRQKEGREQLEMNHRQEQRQHEADTAEEDSALQLAAPVQVCAYVGLPRTSGRAAEEERGPRKPAGKAVEREAKRPRKAAMACASPSPEIEPADAEEARRERAARLQSDQSRAETRLPEEQEARKPAA